MNTLRSELMICNNYFTNIIKLLAWRHVSSNGNPDKSDGYNYGSEPKLKCLPARSRKAFLHDFQEPTRYQSPTVPARSRNSFSGCGPQMAAAAFVEGGEGPAAVEGGGAGGAGADV